MADQLPVLALAKKLAHYATARHATIAQNVANADTPGYRAKDLKPFDANLALRESREADLRRRPQLTETYELKSVEFAPNENSVSLEDQMMRASEAQLQHATALSIYSKTLDLMRLSIGRR